MSQAFKLPIPKPEKKKEQDKTKRSHKHKGKNLLHNICTLNQVINKKNYDQKRYIPRHAKLI